MFFNFCCRCNRCNNNNWNRPCQCACDKKDNQWNKVDKCHKDNGWNKPEHDKHSCCRCKYDYYDYKQDYDNECQKGIGYGYDDYNYLGRRQSNQQGYYRNSGEYYGSTPTPLFYNSNWNGFNECSGVTFISPTIED